MDSEQSNEPRMSGRGDGGTLVGVEPGRYSPAELSTAVGF